MSKSRIEVWCNKCPHCGFSLYADMIGHPGDDYCVIDWEVICDCGRLIPIIKHGDRYIEAFLTEDDRNKYSRGERYNEN